MWGGVALSEEQGDHIIRCEKLDLSGARLDIKGEYDFFRSIVPKMRRLLYVDLSRTHLTDSSAPLLFELMRPQRGLLDINLSRNDLGPKCFDIVADTVGGHSTLQRLDVSRNFSLVRHEHHAKRLGSAIGACRSLSSISISLPHQVVVGDEGIQADELAASARLKRELIKFYDMYNPQKTPHVDVFMRRYRGVEGGIGPALRQKYPRADLDAIERAATACLESHSNAQAQHELHREMADADSQHFAIAFFKSLVTGPGQAGAAPKTAASPRRKATLNRFNRQGRKERRTCQLGVVELSSTRVAVRELLAMQRLGVLSPKLSVLRLSACDVGSPGAKVIAGFLRDGYLPSLMELGLSSNGIDDDGGCALAKVLAETAGASILTLDLTCNRLGCVNWLSISEQSCSFC